MADNLEQVGLQFTAEDADPFLAQIDATQKQIDDLARSFKELGETNADLGKTAGGLGNVGSTASTADASLKGFLVSLEKIPLLNEGVAAVSPAFVALSGAADAAGAVATSAFAPLLVTIGALVAVIGGAILAFNALGDAAGAALESASQMTEAIDNIQSATGFSDQLSAGIMNVERGFGAADGTMLQMFEHLSRGELSAERTMDRFDQKVANSGAKAGNALERAGETLQRAIANATDNANTQLQNLVDNLDKATRNYQQKALQRDEDYARRRADDEAALQQQLEDMALAHADKIDSINQSIADLQDSRTQDTEDRQAALQDRLGTLEEQAQAKRDAINAKYYAPKGAREKQAQKEELALVDEQLAAQEKKEKDKAQREEDKAIAAYNKKLARLQESLAREDEQYAKQAARLNAQYARREEDAKRSYDREVASANQSYNDLVAANQKAQVAVQAQLAKTIDNAQYQYQASLDRFVASTTGAHAAVLPPLNRTVDALQRLGINYDDFVKLSPQEQFELIAKKIDAMPPSLERTSLAMQLLGSASDTTFKILHTVATEGMQGVQDKAKNFLTASERDHVEKYNKSLNDARTALDTVNAHVGALIAEALTPLIDKFNIFWTLHGPQVERLLKKLAETVLPPLVDIAGKFLDIIGKLLDKFDTSPQFFDPFIAQANNILTSFSPVLRLLESIVNTISWINTNRNAIEGIGYEIGTFFRQSFTPGHAAGGPVHAGEPGMVGELGPEMFVPRHEGYIIPQTYRQNVPAMPQYNNVSSSHTTNNPVFNITVTGAGGYQAGYQTGLGIRDALRAKGVPLAGYVT